MESTRVTAGDATWQHYKRNESHLGLFIRGRRSGGTGQQLTMAHRGYGVSSIVRSIQAQWPSLTAAAWLGRNVRGTAKATQSGNTDSHRRW